MIKPNSIEEHSVYIEMEVEISCMVYEEKEIKTIQDMYCPGKKMDFKKTLLYLHYNNNLKRFWKCVLQYTVPDR